MSKMQARIGGKIVADTLPSGNRFAVCDLESAMLSQAAEAVISKIVEVEGVEPVSSVMPS